MESNPPAIAKRLLQIVRVMYLTFRKGVSKRKLMMDLHLLFKRSKIASKAIGNLMFHHGNHHHHHERSAGFSCRSMDPNTSFYSPREVEFSCSNTPYIHAGKRKNRHHRYAAAYNHDALALQKAFELLNSSEISDFGEVMSTAASPMPLWAFGNSPIVRQLRITDSPFPINEEEEGDVDSKVDREAEEFIGRFYEQLRLQQ